MQQSPAGTPLSPRQSRPFVSGRTSYPASLSSPRTRPFAPAIATRLPAPPSDRASSATEHVVDVNLPAATDWPDGPTVRAPGDERAPDALELPPAEDELVGPTLALHEAVEEATRHADAMAAADVMESVARRLRQGDILLSPGAPLDSEAAVVASVLQSLLGHARRGATG